MGLTWLVGTPVTVVLAWWLWFRDRSSRELQKWRETLFLFGPIATSLNAWKVQNVCGNIATYLCLAASLLGKGRSRTSLGASAVLGFMLWVPIGILQGPWHAWLGISCFRRHRNRFAIS